MRPMINSTRQPMLAVMQRMRRPARLAPWPMKLAEWVSRPLAPEPTCSAAAPKPRATTCNRA